MSSPLRRRLGLVTGLLALSFSTPLAPADAQVAAPAQSQASSANQTGSATQTSSSAPTLAVDARLVNLPVVVHDKKGTLVQNLTKDQFVLTIDGHPQAIRYFDHDSNLPLTLGLLVDTSRSVAGVLDDERTASAAFLDTMLASDKDRAFVLHFARQAELLQDLTNSKPKLQAALRELDTDTSGGRSNVSADPDNSGGRASRGGGTVLYDAAFLAADELMAKQTGRKALILLTDGDDRGSKESLTSSIEAAQRANTIVYAIYFKGEQSHDNNNSGGYPGGGRRGGIGFPGGGGGGYPGGGGGYPGGRGGGGNPGGRSTQDHVDGKKVLERITGETGGRVFEISKKETVAQIYNQIADELRAQYRLAFTPDATTAADGYHQVDLTLPKAKDLRIQTRDGYYAGK